MNRPYRVMFDAGHGGKDPGAINKDLDIKEKDITLKIAITLRHQAMGGDYLFMPYVTRDNDYYASLQSRCYKAILCGAHAFVSIHCNARLRKGKPGIELEAYNYPGSEKGRRLSGIMMNYLCDDVEKKIECFSRGVKEKEFYVLKHTPMPATLIELGFITDNEEALFLSEEENQKVIAKSIADAAEYFVEGGNL